MLFGKMKKTVAVALTATMLVSAQFGAIGALAAPAKPAPKKIAAVTTTKVPAPSINKTEITINGFSNQLETITQGAGTLVSVRDFNIRFGSKAVYSKATKTLTITYGTTTLAVQDANKYVKINAQQKFMKYAPRLVKGKFFLEISQLTEFLGGQVLDTENGKEYYNFKLLVGALYPQWISENAIIVTKETDEGYDHFVMSTDSRKYTKLNITANTEYIVASPDGTKVAYTDDDSNVYTYSLAFDKETKISTDISTKLELTWAPDSNSLYYIDGEKQSSVCNMTMEGVITKYAADGNDYKSDLRVLSNTTLLYTVTKTSKVTQDTSGVKDGEELPDFEVVIDPSGTEPTLYTVDLTTETKTPVKITTTLENKTYSGLLPDGTVVYLSTDFTDENSVPILKSISKSLVSTNHVIFNVEPISVKVLGDKLMAFGLYYDEDENGDPIIKQYVYELDPTRGKAKTLVELPEIISNVFIGSSNQIVAQDMDGKTYLVKKDGLHLLAN